MEVNSLGIEPIHPDQPVGSDVRYEPEYEQLQTEIGKLSSPSASGGVDWKKVSDLAAGILDKKCKDLLVASYLAVAQVHIRRIDGLADGLKIIHDLIAHYWSDLYPPKKRLRGRLAAIEWWIEQTETAMKGMKSQPVEVKTVEAIHHTLEQIDSLLTEHLPEPPLLRPIQRVLEEIPSEPAAQPEPDAAPVGERSQPEKPPEPRPAAPPERDKPAPAADAPQELATEQDAHKLIVQGLQKVRQAAAFLLERAPMNPEAYRHRRIAAWSLVSKPPAETNGQTRIPPPPPQVVQTLLNHSANGNWNALIAHAEQRLSQFIFWFDLNRFSVEALAALGDEYQNAREVVCRETAFFLNRFPTLADLTFGDGTPFADSETRQWLDDIAIGAHPIDATTDTVPESVNAAGTTDQVADTMSKALALAKKKKLSDAVQLLQSELKNCGSQKEALRWRLEMCRMLIRSNRTDMALPHLELILKDIDIYRLQRWDPRLALEGLKLVWTAFAKHADKEVKRNADAVFSQIVKLDPAEALKLSKR